MLLVTTPRFEPRSTGVRAMVAGLQVRAAAPTVKRIVLHGRQVLISEVTRRYPLWLTSSALPDAQRTQSTTAANCLWLGTPQLGLQQRQRHSPKINHYM